MCQDAPCPHWPWSWPTSPRTEPPTRWPSALPHPLTPAAVPLGLTCCPPAAEGWLPPPLPAGSAPCRGQQSFYIRAQVSNSGLWPKFIWKLDLVREAKPNHRLSCSAAGITQHMYY